MHHWQPFISLVIKLDQRKNALSVIIFAFSQSKNVLLVTILVLVTKLQQSKKAPLTIILAFICK